MNRIVTTAIAVSLVQTGLADLATRCRAAGRPELAREIGHWPRPGVEWSMSDWDILADEIERVQRELCERDDWRNGGATFFAMDFAGFVLCAAAHMRWSLYWRATGDLKFWRDALREVQWYLGAR